MKTTNYYVIRWGWNAANQSSYFCNKSKKGNFGTNYYSLVDIVEASSEYEARSKVSPSVTVYNNQGLIFVTNPRSIRGLTTEIKHFQKAI